MLRPALSAFVTLLGLALAAPLAAQRRVWVVDAGGGPGVDFTDIAPAISAAAPGDRVEVRGAGQYRRFVLDKGLDLEAVVAGVRADGSEVRGVPAGQSGRVAGFSAPSLRVDGCAGPVLLANLQLATSAVPALVIADSGSVLLLRSTVASGTGPVFPGIGAVTVNRSRLSVQGCTLTAGNGRHAHPISGPATSGGTPLVATDSSLLVVDTSCTAGNGGAGYAFVTCNLPPSSGGHGVQAINTTTLVMHGCRLTRGMGGPALSPCPGGSDGQAIDATGIGARVTSDCTLIGGVVGAAIIPNLTSLTSPGVATRGQPVTLTFAGAPGTWLLTYLDVTHGHIQLPGIDGPLLVTPLAISIGLLSIGATGVLPVTLPVPADPALQDQVVFCQSAAIASPTSVSLTNVGELRIR